MFEKSSRLKLRFESVLGVLSSEDLWDLPLTSRNSASLDNIAKGINRRLKDSAEESFVVEASKPNRVLKLKLDIVKRVIAIKVEENEAAKKAGELREKKQKILALIAKKKDEDLGEHSVEDLQKMLDEI